MQSLDPRLTQARGWAITLTRVVLVAFLIVLLNVAISWAVARIDVQLWPQHLEIIDRVVLIGVVAYILLMATPFVPGVEVGLALMMVLGPRGVLLAYVCTLVALAASFAIGRILPPHLAVAFLRWLHLRRAERLLATFNAVPAEKRLEFLAQRAPGGVVEKLVARRYLLLALLFNLPGNALIGGGGGIALMAGMSRLYSFPKYVGLLAVAILPGPILILLSDYWVVGG